MLLNGSENKVVLISYQRPRIIISLFHSFHQVSNTLT